MERAAMVATGNVSAKSMTKKINWVDYNYPPLLKLVHYDINELEGEGKEVMTWVHRSFLFMLATLIFNFLANLVLSFGGVKLSGFGVMFSIFNIIIFGTLGGYSFYMCYKGVALNISNMTMKHMVLQFILFVFYFIFMLAHPLNMEGWTNFERIKSDGGKMKGWWTFTTVTESVLWIANMGLTGYSVFRVRQFRENSWKNRA